MSALDRIPTDLVALPAAEALDHVAVWLNDCDTHLATGRPGGLPCPPFSLFDAFVLVLEARDVRRGFDLLAAAHRAASAAPPQSIAVLASQEWFDPKETIA